MRGRAQGAGDTKFLVVLIPTKESVFWPRVKNPENHKEFQALIDDEDRLKSELIEYFKSENILFLDVLTPLRNAKVQPYFQNADGHPNFEGHRIIAENIEKIMKQN